MLAATNRTDVLNSARDCFAIGAYWSESWQNQLLGTSLYIFELLLFVLACEIGFL
jgi:hypothetical protein